jgi:hypothetical protein
MAEDKGKAGTAGTSRDDASPPAAPIRILIRRYKLGDGPQLLRIIRDANDTLRASRGGAHPDDAIDRMNAKPDSALLKLVLNGSRMFVAEVEGTGELAGMGAHTDNLTSALLGSTYSRAHYVLGEFQHGKAGVSVGKLLRMATIESAKKRGFRKMYGFSTPEAVGFHKKCGAVFHPEHNHRYLDGSVEVHYYDMELRKSFLNRFAVEPVAYKAVSAFFSFVESVKKALGDKAD